MTDKTKKYQTRLARLLDFLPKWLKPVAIFFSLVLIHIIGISCSICFTIINYHVWMGLFSTKTYGVFVTPRINAEYYAILFNLFISIIAMILFVHFLKQRFVYIVSLFVSFLVVISFADTKNDYVNLTKHNTYKLVPAILIFIATFLLLMLLIPYLLKKYEEPQTPTFAIPVKLNEH